MSDLTSQETEDAKDTNQYIEERYTDNGDPGRAPRIMDAVEETRDPIASVEYRVYKRRWFGLMQLVLLNVIVSWDVSVEDMSPIATPLQSQERQGIA